MGRIIIATVLKNPLKENFKKFIKIALKFLILLLYNYANMIQAKEKINHLRARVIRCSKSSLCEDPTAFKAFGNKDSAVRPGKVFISKI